MRYRNSETIMLSTCTILRAVETPPIILAPLPYAILSQNSNLKQYIDQETNPLYAAYFALLHEYLTHITTSPWRNAELKDAVLRYIATEENIAIKAASYNLLGFLQRDMNDFTAAKQSFESALSLRGLVDFSKACLLTNLAETHIIEKHYTAAFELQTKAIAYIDDINPPTDLESHVIANFYSTFGFLNIKLNHMDIAYDSYLKSMMLWHDNPLVDLDTCMNLSKINSVSALELADNILANLKTDALEHQAFIPLYYRADINIKLAAHAEAKQQDTIVNHYTHAAMECIIAAKEANNSYPENAENEQQKNLAKIYYLYTNLMYVHHERDRAKEFRVAAETKRSKVDEPKEKFAKFLEKFPDLDVPFNTTQLFRRR